MIALLSLGANAGDRQAHLDRALQALPGIGVRVLRHSRWLETRPDHATGRRWFLNGVAEVETDLPPRVLLRRLKSLERAAGRRRLAPVLRHSPRPLDLDIVAYGRARIRTPELAVPHPGRNRRFVQAGLREMLPVSDFRRLAAPPAPAGHASRALPPAAAR